MSDLRDLGQRYVAALWDAVGTLDGDAARTVDRLGGLVAAVTEAEAQLAGLRLHLLHEAKLAAAEAVIDGVRQSVRTTPAEATATASSKVTAAEIATPPTNVISTEASTAEIAAAIVIIATSEEAARASTSVVVATEATIIITMSDIKTQIK